VAGLFVARLCTAAVLEFLGKQGDCDDVLELSWTWGLFLEREDLRWVIIAGRWAVSCKGGDTMTIDKQN
jgi:hypothetical protein